MSLLESFFLALYFTIFVVWIVLLVSVFADIFRSKDLGGWAKAAWVFFLVVLPYLGVLIYLIARGSGMHERNDTRARQAQEQADAYIREVAAVPSRAEELARLAELRDNNVLSDAEFERQKAKILE